jgi:hypothetical protein
MQFILYIRRNMKVEKGSFYNGLEWLMDFFLTSFTMLLFSFYPKSNPLLLKNTNFEVVMCTQFLSKSSVPYTVGSAFSIAMYHSLDLAQLWFGENFFRYGCPKFWVFWGPCVNYISVGAAMARNSGNPTW